MLTEGFVVFSFDEEDSLFDSEELMLELEAIASLDEDFSSWLLEDESSVFWVSDEDDSFSSAEELRVVSSEDDEI